MGAITIVTAGAVVLEPTLEAVAFWLVFAACIGVLAAEAFRPGKSKPREQAEQSKKGTPWASIWITAAAPVALLVLVPLLASLERPIFNDLRLQVDAVEIDRGVRRGRLLRRRLRGISFAVTAKDEDRECQHE